MSVFTPRKSPKHTKDYYSDYITAEDREDEEPDQPNEAPAPAAPQT